MFRWASLLDNEDVRYDLFRSYDLEEGFLLKGNHGRKVKRFISKKSDCESCFGKICVSHPIISNQSSVLAIYNMGVSKINGTPKSSILIGFSIINYPFWGTPIFGNIHII